MELKGLKTEFLGKNLIFFQSIDSTQKKIKSLKTPENGRRACRGTCGHCSLQVQPRGAFPIRCCPEVS